MKTSIVNKNGKEVTVKIVFADPSESWLSLNSVGVASLSGGACVFSCYETVRSFDRPQFISFADLKAGETVIYVNPTTVDGFSDNQLKWIIGHELGHIFNDDGVKNVPEGMSNEDYDIFKELRADRYADAYAGKMSFLEKLKIFQALAKTLVSAQISQKSFRRAEIGNFGGWVITSMLFATSKPMRKRVLALLK